MNHLNPETKDVALDRVLQGMRSAQPSADMQGRILKALESRTHAAASTRSAGIQAIMRGMVWPAGVCAAALLVAMIVFLRAAPKHQQPAAEITTAVTSAQPARAATPTHAAMPTQLSRSSPHRFPVIAEPKREPVPDAQSVETAALLDDMRAPSQPAPPLPLNRQERMLIMLGRQGERENVATVTPITLPFTSPGEEKEFRQFFERSPATQPISAANQAATQKNGEPQ